MQIGFSICALLLLVAPAMATTTTAVHRASAHTFYVRSAIINDIDLGQSVRIKLNPCRVHAVYTRAWDALWVPRAKQMTKYVIRRWKHFENRFAVDDSDDDHVESNTNIYTIDAITFRAVRVRSLLPLRCRASGQLLFVHRERDAKTQTKRWLCGDKCDPYLMRMTQWHAVECNRHLRSKTVIEWRHINHNKLPENKNKQKAHFANNAIHKNEHDSLTVNAAVAELNAVYDLQRKQRDLQMERQINIY